MCEGSTYNSIVSCSTLKLKTNTTTVQLGSKNGTLDLIQMCKLCMILTVSLAISDSYH